MNLGIRIFVPRWRVGVALIAINEEQKVFMLHHVFRPHAPWGLPGGWMSRHESPEACIRREIREETGLAIQLGPVVHVSQDLENAHMTIYYLGHLSPGLLALSSEILDAAWVDPLELPTNLFPSSLQAIEKAFASYPQWMAEKQVWV